jgi:DNA-binding GntR family transcriptional regulator
MQQHIEGYQQLEALVAMAAEPGREWTAESLAGQLRTPVPPVAEALEHLRQQGLVEPAPDATAGAWRYGPQTAELRTAVAELAQVFADDRLALIELLSVQALDRLRTSALRTFAEAFRLKRRNP